MGVVLLKYWLEVSPEEQTNRLTARIDDKRKIWKLSQMDLDSYSRWDDYTRARDDMFQATDTAWAPWFIARSDNKRQAQLDIISHLLSSIPYKKVPRGDVKLPKRNVARSKPLRNSENCSGGRLINPRSCTTSGRPLWVKRRPSGAADLGLFNPQQRTSEDCPARPKSANKRHCTGGVPHLLATASPLGKVTSKIVP